MKKRGYERPSGGFLPIHMPKNTGAGIILAGLSTAFGFTMIWQMWLPAALSFLTLVVVAIAHTFNYKRDYYIPVDDVIRTEAERTHLLSSHV